MDRTELKYLQEAPEGYEPPVSVKSDGRKHQRREVLRIYGGDIEVEIPFGFDIEVDRARGKQGLYPLKVSSVEERSSWEFVEAIDREGAVGRKNTVAREIDGERALFRVTRASPGSYSGAPSCELVEGRVMIYKRGQLVED